MTNNSSALIFTSSFVGLNYQNTFMTKITQIPTVIQKLRPHWTMKFGKRKIAIGTRTESRKTGLMV